MNNRKQNAVRNLMFGLINKAIVLLTPFFIFAMIRKNLGAEYLGLNSLFASLLQILSLAEIGIGSALVHEMYKPAASNNSEELSTILNLYKKIYKVIAVIVLAIGLILLPFIPHLVSGKVPSDINIYILFIIYLLNTTISYSMFAYKRSILNAYQRTDVISKINSIVNIIMYVSQFIILVIFKNYYLYVITIPICTIIDNVFVNIIVNKMYPSIKARGMVDSKVKKSVIKKVRALAGHKIGAVVISSLDSIVISAFLGLHSLALYSNYFYVVKALNGIINIGFNSVLPGIGNSLVLENKEHNLKLFEKLNFALSLFVGFSFICLINLYQPFINIWMGKDFILPISVMVLFALYFYVWQIRVMGLAFKDAAGMWNEDFWKPYIGLVVNLVTNIILVKLIGISGALISTILIMIFIYYPWEIRILYKKLFETSSKKLILFEITHFVLTIIIAFITYRITSSFNYSNIINIILTLATCCIITSVIYLVIYCKKRELKDLILDIKKVFLKKMV